MCDGFVDQCGGDGVPFIEVSAYLSVVGEALLRCDNKTIRRDGSRGETLFAAVLSRDSSDTLAEA